MLGRVVLALAMLSSLAAAAEHPLRGTKLLVSAPAGNPAGRKLVLVATETAAITGNPLASGAELTIAAQGGTSTTQTFVLPASGWRPLGTFGFRYADPGTGQAIKSVLLKRSGSGVVTLKVTAKGRYGPLDVVPPAPGDDATVVLAFGENAYCVGFGGAAGGEERRDEAGKWLIVKSAAVACPAETTTTVAPETTTTSSTTTSTSSSTSTSTSVSTSSTTTTSSSTTTSTSSSTTTTLVVQLNLLYVHGIQNCTSSRQNAGGALAALEAAVDAALPARIAAWEAAHPGIEVVTQSARANLYTATPSGFHPSDSTNPLDMDDWEVGDPGCTTSQQGDACTTAYEWRHRLAAEVERLFPAPAKNVVLIGHSNGARTAVDVASNAGTGGPNTHDWGVAGRIAGVVTLHGLIDEIGSSQYDVAGPLSFETSCKNGEAIFGFGDSCAPGNGFCEWAGRVDASPAADWVANNKRALMLTSWGSCSPAAWSGRSDGTLPYDAQASPWAVGLDMTPAPGETWREANGQRYGAFCHSDLTNGSSGNHVAARNAARDRVLDWLFVAAPRVAARGSNTTGSLALNQSTGNFTMGGSCPASEIDDTVTQGTKGAGIDVVGVCRHPGFFDGDDHAIASSEFTVTNGATCNGTYRWTQAHDADDPHAAGFWWKTRSLRSVAPELLGALPTG